jgi:hypothetical protein
MTNTDVPGHTGPWDDAAQLYESGTLEQRRAAVGAAYTTELPEPSDRPCWQVLSPLTLDALAQAGADGSWRGAIEAGEQMLRTGEAPLKGEEWDASEYWVPDDYFPEPDDNSDPEAYDEPLYSMWALPSA